MIVVHAFGASLLHERGGGVGVWLREAKNDASVHRLIFVTSEPCVQVASVLLPVKLHYIGTIFVFLIEREMIAIRGRVFIRPFYLPVV